MSIIGHDGLQNLGDIVSGRDTSSGYVYFLVQLNGLAASGLLPGDDPEALQS